MFIFYYAVLSEVSPPTALSPFAAAAITGGNPFKTMMLTWKYTLPAFLVPFAFTLTPEGIGAAAAGAGPARVLWTIATAAIGIGGVRGGLRRLDRARRRRLSSGRSWGWPGAAVLRRPAHWTCSDWHLTVVVLVLHWMAAFPDEMSSETNR